MLQGCSNLGNLGGLGRGNKAKKSFGDVNPSRPVRGGPFLVWLAKTKRREASALEAASTKESARQASHPNESSSTPWRLGMVP